MGNRVAGSRVGRVSSSGPWTLVTFGGGGGVTADLTLVTGFTYLFILDVAQPESPVDQVRLTPTIAGAAPAVGSVYSSGNDAGAGIDVKLAADFGVLLNADHFESDLSAKIWIYPLADRILMEGQVSVLFDDGGTTTPFTSSWTLRAFDTGFDGFQVHGSAGGGIGLGNPTFDTCTFSLFRLTES